MPMFGRKRPESDSAKAEQDLIPENLVAPLAKTTSKPPTPPMPPAQPAGRTPPFSAPRPTTHTTTAPEGSAASMSSTTSPSPLLGVRAPTDGASARPADPFTRPTAPAAKPEQVEMRQLIVGREISLSGEIKSCDRLLVEGNVEANLASCREVEIAESGLFKGTANVDDMELRGRFEGTLTVKGRLFIRAAGRLTGKVTYGQIEIECGGQVSGEVQSHPAETSHAPASSPEAPTGNAEPGILRRERSTQPVIDVGAPSHSS
jgi:cytoskeletal protein CcmA (bactofilin family)